MVDTHTHSQSISGDVVGVKMALTSDASLVPIADKCSNLYPGKPSQVSNLFFMPSQAIWSYQGETHFVSTQ